MGRRIRDYDEDYVLNQRPARLGWKILGVVVAVALVLGCVGFAFRWLNAGAEVVSPQNVKAQWQFAYDYDEALAGAARQWCTIRQAEVQAPEGSDAQVQRASQRIAVEQLYARNKAEYDARLRDAFRAKWVKPSDVPVRAPALEEKLQEVGCAVPAP